MKISAKCILTLSLILGLSLKAYSAEPTNLNQTSLKSYLITRVYNESARTAVLAKNTYTQPLEISANKYLDLALPIQVPVSSIQSYLQNFVFDDNHFVPNNALSIKTQAGEFKLWVNEDGIHVCKLETHVNLQQKERLCSHEQISHLGNNLRFLLLVDNNGLLKLQPLKR